MFSFCYNAWPNTTEITVSPRDVMSERPIKGAGDIAHNEIERLPKVSTDQEVLIPPKPETARTSAGESRQDHEPIAIATASEFEPDNLILEESDSKKEEAGVIGPRRADRRERRDLLREYLRLKLVDRLREAQTWLRADGGACGHYDSGALEGEVPTVGVGVALCLLYAIDPRAVGPTGDGDAEDYQVWTKDNKAAYCAFWLGWERTSVGDATRWFRFREATNNPSFKINEWLNGSGECDFNTIETHFNEVVGFEFTEWERADYRCEGRVPGGGLEDELPLHDKEKEWMKRLDRESVKAVGHNYLLVGPQFKPSGRVHGTDSFWGMLRANEHYRAHLIELSRAVE
jgi:hypothetical protein